MYFIGVLMFSHRLLQAYREEARHPLHVRVASGADVVVGLDVVPIEPPRRPGGHGAVRRVQAHQHPPVGSVTTPELLRQQGRRVVGLGQQERDVGVPGQKS